MKIRIITLLSAVLLFVCELRAQAPQSFNYQAVARDVSGKILANQNVGVKIIIHVGSSTGTPVYAETFTTTTNLFGLFTLAIGSASSAKRNIQRYSMEYWQLLVTGTNGPDRRNFLCRYGNHTVIIGSFCYVCKQFRNKRSNGSNRFKWN